MSMTEQNAYATIPVEQIREVIGLLHQGENLRAETKLTPLVHEFPDDIHILALHGDALRKLGRHEEAILSYRQALAGGLREPELILDFAQSLIHESAFPEADALVDEVLAARPDDVKALSMKGDILRKRGGPLAALEYYRKALMLQPGNISLYKVLSLLEPFSPESRVFEVLHKALKTDIKDPRERASILATLGKAYLDIGEDTRSFQCYRRANQLMNTSLPPFRGGLEHRLAYTRDHYTQALFERLSGYGEPSCPQIIVAGMSRSGKSLVESLFRGVEGVSLMGETTLLSDHEKLVLAAYSGSEDQWLAFQTPEQVQHDAEEYLKRLRALSDEDTIRITTMPGDIWNLGLIGLWAPNVPIVFCMRDVLDLAVTGYFQQYQNPEGYRYSYDLESMGRQIAIFEKLMEHWAQVLPNPIYLVDYEAVVNDPRAVMNNLFEQLGLRRTQSYEGIIDANAGLEACISPIASQDAAMPITRRFVGISRRFSLYLSPVVKGYREIIEQFPRREPPVIFSQPLPKTLRDTFADSVKPSPRSDFNWQFQGRIKVMDNGGVLLRDGSIHQLLGLNAFDIVVLDPGTVIAVDDDLRKQDALRFITGTTLGDGRPKTWHTCGQPLCNGTLKPLSIEILPPRLREAGQVQWREPIHSVALDDIAGPRPLEWLVLDAGYDAKGVLEHGERTLANTLLIQVNLAAQPTWAGQPGLDTILDWAQGHGFRLHRMLDQTMLQAMEERKDLPRQPETSELWLYGLLLVPDDRRLATLTENQRLKLAFILHSIFQIKDLSYSVLQQVDVEVAEKYLEAGGFFERRKDGPGNAELDAIRRDLKAGKVHRHLAVLGHLETRYPKDPQILRLAAERYFWLGAAQPALDKIRQAMEIVPEDIGIRLTAIEILLHAGIWWEANHAARALLVHEQENRDAMRLVARALAADPIPNTVLIEGTIDILRQIIEEANDETDPDLIQMSDISTQARLHARVGLFDQALRLHMQALDGLGADIRGPQRAALLISQADSLFESGDADASCLVLWEACCCRPYSPLTVTASIKLNQRLTHCSAPALNKLAVLHGTIQGIWSEYKKENLKASFGDFGLPYQAFEPLMLPGTRPAMHRLDIYGLEQDLPPGARALDIGCNHGYLLMGLASRLKQGLGFDISQICIDVGNAVATHLGYSHIELSSKPFDEFICEEPFDLVIACAVHHWIGVPMAEFGTKLHSYCKPGGIVLLESQGTRHVDKVEPEFKDKAGVIVDAGFEIIRKGSLCDDAINYREFWVLKKRE